LKKPFTNSWFAEITLQSSFSKTQDYSAEAREKKAKKKKKTPSVISIEHITQPRNSVSRQKEVYHILL